MVEIGSRTTGPVVNPYTRQSRTASELGAGVGVAMQNLGLTVTQYNQYRMQRDRAEEENRTALELTRLQGEWSRTMMELQRTAPETAAGFTDQAHSFLRTETENFLSTIQDPKIREAYATRMEAFVQEGTTQAFTFEFERGNAAFVRGARDRLSTAQTVVYEDPELFDDQLADIESSIRSSTLTLPEQEALLDEVYSGLAGAAYQRQIEDSLDSFEPTGPTDGGDVVAPGLTGTQRGVLNTIAGVESPGYDVMYGGGRFSDYSDHPRQYITITEGPHQGEKSSAAGRYQFLASTWDEAVDELAAQGIIIPDFSPASQDRVALYVAQRTWRRYASRNGLETDMDAFVAGATYEDLRHLKTALGGTREGGIMWEGIFKMDSGEFSSTILGSSGEYGGGTEGEYTPIPDAVRDPRFSELPFETRMQMTQAAQTAHAERLRAATAAQRDAEIATHNQLASDFMAGNPGSYEAIQQALESGTIRDVGLQDDLRRRVAEYEEGIIAHQQTANSIAQGLTLTSEDEDAVMDYYRHEGVLAGIQAGEAAALQTLVADTRQTNYIPQPIVNTLMQQLGSQNPQQAQYAAEALSALYKSNPQAFMAHATEDQVKMASMVASIMDSAPTPADAADRVRYMSDPQTRQERDYLMEEGAKVVAQAGVIDGHLTNMLDTWTGAEPTMPILPSQAVRLRSQYRDLYLEGFVRFGGDGDKAREWALANIEYNWSVDPTNGGLMENSPLAMGANVPMVLGTKDWIEESVRSQIGVGGDTQISLIADAQTRQEFAAGQPPTYTVVTQVEDANGFGMIDIPLDENGRPRRVEMRPTEGQRINESYTLEMQRLDAKIDALAAKGSQSYDLEGTGDLMSGLTPQDRAALNSAINRREWMRGLDPLEWDEQRQARPSATPRMETPEALNPNAPGGPGVEVSAAEIARRINQMPEPQGSESLGQFSMQQRTFPQDTPPPAMGAGGAPPSPPGSVPGLQAPAADTSPSVPQGAAPGTDFTLEARGLIEDMLPLFGDPTRNTATMRRLRGLMDDIEASPTLRRQLLRRINNELSSLPSSEKKSELQARLLTIIEAIQ